MITPNEDNVITLEECDRAKTPNPQGYTELQLVEIAEYKRLLTQSHPTMPDLLINTAIDFYMQSDKEELKKDIESGKFDFSTSKKKKEIKNESGC